MKDRSPVLPLKHRLVRLGIWLLLATVALYAAIVWWCAKQIAEPPRREIQLNAQPYLGGTAEAGFTIDSFTSSDGMPCLVCTPEATKTVSKRAGIIRDQLAERGIKSVESGGILGTLVILHGRGGIKEDYLAVAERFCAVGFRCVIPDLPGHGSNPTKYATYGVKEGRMINSCFSEASEKYSFPTQPCAVLGQSMGGSVAAHAVAIEGSPFRSMVIISSFDRLESVLRSQTGGLLGSTLGHLVSEPTDRVFAWKTGVKISNISPAEKVSGLRIPVMVVHGDDDDMVPTSAGRALYESLPDTIDKQWVEVPGATHNNVLVTDFPLYATMAEWFLKHLGDG